jgi:hypothetical protein
MIALRSAVRPQPLQKNGGDANDVLHQLLIDIHMAFILCLVAPLMSEREHSSFRGGDAECVSKSSKRDVAIA